MGGLNMEILNNFSSIYCFITFIFGAMFMFTTFCIAAMCKTQKQKNNVHFYVAKDKAFTKLFIGEPVLCDYRNVFYGYFHNGKYVSVQIALEAELKDFGLNLDDFADMKDGEIREVFLNLED